ncbi:putative ribonucleoside-triphosphate reductase [Escherichia phage JLBYU41]|uniref:Ribonucleoside-triphosphate reductase n=1 Tax=Escherichia phage JLBYU41 TaxID=2894750 RepID=A0AAE8YZV8_9CAUD|nr:putative ribonucleoside-triphosphate reductase [Escherichia phage JLBYU09]UGO55931.1 putative ribonucleoside-triphosphate reductase [Escherichia phage JLBYU41]
MNYNEIARMATEGINFFSDSNGEFKCITQRGSVEIIGGEEVEKPEISVMINGLIRSPKVREVDGETIRVTDKLGVFNNKVEIKNGYHIDVDGELYVVVEARPIRQTNVTVAYRPILRRISVHG